MKLMFLSSLSSGARQFTSIGKLLICAVLLLGYGDSVQAQERIVLKFGLYTAVKPTAMIQKFRPLTKDIERKMSEELNRPVDIQFKVAPSYEGGISHIASGEADFARFGPTSYIEALKENPNLVFLAAESKDGSRIAEGVICVKSDSPIKTISDLKGKSFAFGSELSTIGRYLSQLHLLEHGITAGMLSRYEYLERHDAVGAAVGSGRFDAGALKEQTFNSMKAEGTPLRELARFPNAPQAWLAREGMDGTVLAALKKALLALRDEKALEALNADELVEGAPEDYALVRKAMERNEAFFQ